MSDPDVFGATSGSPPRTGPVRPPLVRALFLAVFVATVVLLYAGTYLRPNPFTVLDWAMNYAGGFTRRGLAGAALAELSEMTGLAIVHLVFALKVVLYGVFLLATYALNAGLGFPTAGALLVWSPIFVTYQVSS